MQGALFGARSLGTGFGPILFATVFSMFSRTDSPFPYFPGDALNSTRSLYEHFSVISVVPSHVMAATRYGHLSHLSC